jgi:palmitoyl transferase
LGLGIGKYRYDKDGDWQGIYLMAFLDSQSKIEPIAGYGFQKVWQPTEKLKLGIGYTVGVTFRDDYDYLPIPVILPLMSAKYKQLAIQSTYILGGQGHGNVLFTWLRLELN